MPPPPDFLQEKRDHDKERIENPDTHRRGLVGQRLTRNVGVADLEEPEPDEDALTIELGRTPRELVEEIKTKLHLTSKE